MGWLSSWCKSCKVKYRKDNWDNELGKQRTRRCNDIRENIPIKTIEQRRKYEKEYYLKNREKILERAREYRLNNLSRIKERQKLYRELNSEKITNDKREYKNKRKSLDPCYSLKLRISKLVAITLQKRDVCKHGKSFWETMEYTPGDLFKHIESKFTDGMNWDNRNMWHIDHIKPQSLFKFNDINDSEFKECWSLENLQPLWAIDNLKKYNYYKTERIQ